MTVLDTARLTLRELTPDDLDFVSAMLASPLVMRHYPATLDRDGAAQWLERQLMRYERDGHGLWLVSERSTGAPVGQIGLMIHHVDGMYLPEVGWLLDAPYWGRGFATEAARAVRDWAFRIPRYSRVISLIRPINTPSAAVARRIGMTVEREVMFHDYLHQVFTVHQQDADPEATVPFPWRLETERLSLVGVTPALARADLEGRTSLIAALGIEVPEEWPPELYDADAIRFTLAMLKDPANDGWAFYYVVRRGRAPVTIGIVGYKGAPASDGTMEIGYGLLPAFQGHGYATEAARALVANAFRDPRVSRVTAETLPELEASQRVLRRLHFSFIGDGCEPGVIRFEITRTQYESLA